MQAQKGRTKSALLIWTKSDLSDKVFTLQYGTDLVLGISDLVRFTPIWSDLVIRVTAAVRAKMCRRSDTLIAFVKLAGAKRPLTGAKCPSGRNA